MAQNRRVYFVPESHADALDLCFALIQARIPFEYFESCIHVASALGARARVAVDAALAPTRYTTRIFP